MSWLSGWLRGGNDELGWDDLVRRVSKEIVALARYGARGRVAFPEDVLVRIQIAEGSVDVVRGFIDEPELDRAIAAAVANECDCEPADLPAREYLVVPGERTSIAVTEGAPKTWAVAIEGGDLSGAVVSLPAGRADVRFGRGEWHGSSQHVRNDVVLSETAEYVSRRAGRLVHAGHAFEVEALDQGDTLVVRRANGEALRPARTARGRIAVREGDAIEMTDGAGRSIRLVLRRTAGRDEA